MENLLAARIAKGGNSSCKVKRRDGDHRLRSWSLLKKNRENGKGPGGRRPASNNKHLEGKKLPTDQPDEEEMPG